jgi:hypothetical protein
MLLLSLLLTGPLRSFSTATEPVVSGASFPGEAGKGATAAAVRLQRYLKASRVAIDAARIKSPAATPAAVGITPLLLTGAGNSGPTLVAAPVRDARGKTRMARATLATTPLAGTPAAAADCAANAAVKGGLIVSAARAAASSGSMVAGAKCLP